MTITRWLFLAFLAVGCSRSPEVETGRVYFPQRSIDLGEIPLTPDGHLVQVPVRNVGSGPLNITKVSTSCGCTHAGDFDPVIPAERELSIPLRISSVTPGNGGSSVTVSTNMPGDVPQVVELKWIAIASVETDPLVVDFGNVRPGATHEESISIHRRQANAVVGNWTAAPIGRVSVAPEQDRVTVRIQAGDELGSYSGTVMANVDGAWPPELHIPVRWTVRDRYEAAPNRLFLGQMQSGEKAERSIVITSTEGETLQAVTAQVEGIEGLNTRVNVRSKSCVIVEISWPGSTIEGAHAGTVAIDVHGEENRTLHVPVSAFVIAASADSGAASGVSP